MKKKDNIKLLVVVDMQTDFINGVLGTEQASKIVNNVVNKINMWKGGIFATQDTHFDDTYLNTREGKYLPVKHCLKNTYGWQLNPQVEKVLKAKNVIPIEKQNFASLPLIEIIKIFNDNFNVTEVQFIGLCTDICVISNVMLLKAMLPEINITVDSSCCAGVTPETHKAALDTMKMCQVNII